MRIVFRGISIALIAILLVSCSSKNNQLETVEVTGTRANALRKAPYWNLWIENFPGEPTSARSSLPIKSISTGQPFNVVIDLSTVMYLDAARSRPISREIQEILLRSTKDTITVDVVAIPDERQFRIADGQSRVAKLVVDLKKYRSISNAGIAAPASSPLSSAELNTLARDATFSLGRTNLYFNAKSILGWGQIALSIWVDNRPVDEFTLDVCVKRNDGDTSCAERVTMSEASPGMLGQEAKVSPGGAIHLLRLNSEYLAGVFYCAACKTWGGQYHTWQSPLTVDRFATALENQIIPVFLAASKASDGREVNRSKAENAFRVAGRALYSLVFKPDEGIPRPTSAEKAFLEFASSETVDGRAPVLFSRLIPGNQRLVLTPLNLMLVPMPTGREEFLGFRVAVESFLIDQIVVPSAVCVDKWTLLVPDSGEESPLSTARKPFEPWLARFGDGKVSSSIYEASRLEEFRRWLALDYKEAPGRALITLSHHSEDRLCFSDAACNDIDSIIPADLNRRFTFPSLAVLNGCGTAGVSSIEFVQSLAESGISTVIATSAIVDQEMAGQFLRLLSEEIEKNQGDASYTISQARFDAVVRLRDLKPELGTVPFGSSALNYTLIGDGRVRACIPNI